MMLKYTRVTVQTYPPGKMCPGICLDCLYDQEKCILGHFWQRILIDGCKFFQIREYWEIFASYASRTDQ